MIDQQYMEEKGRESREKRIEKKLMCLREGEDKNKARRICAGIPRRLDEYKREQNIIEEEKN